MKKWFIRKHNEGLFETISSFCFFLVIINFIITILFYYVLPDPMNVVGTSIFGLLTGILMILTFISMIIDSLILLK